MWHHVVLFFIYCCRICFFDVCLVPPYASLCPKRQGYRNHFWGESTQGADPVTSSDCEKWWLIGKTCSLTWASDPGKGDIFHVCVKGPGALIFNVHTVFSIGRPNRHHVRRMSELCSYEIIKTRWQQMHFHLDETCPCNRSYMDSSSFEFHFCTYPPK
jgi:hypothetical protein